MNKNNLSFFQSWFHNYMSNFYSEKPEIMENIKLKEEHTLRVCKNIVHLGKLLNLSKNKLYMAETIALFHDIGRFEQFIKYNTFNDNKSENHAVLGLKILKKNRVLSCLTNKEKEIIYKSIMYHNMPELPDNEDSGCLFYSKLIRDADKMDILYVVTDYYKKRKIHPNPALEFELPDTNEYSSCFIKDILNQRIIKSHELKGYNDMKLMQLSWVFDINFFPTLNYIHQNHYLDKIIKALPDTEEIRTIQKSIKNYVEKRLISKI